MLEAAFQNEVGAGAFDDKQPVSVVQYGEPGRLPITFKQEARENKAKTREAGRAVYDTVDMATIHLPGGKDKIVQPWEKLPVSTQREYRAYYEAWKKGQAIAPVGTPLEMVPWLSAGRVAELKALHIQTLEQFAAISEPDIKAGGMGTRTEVEKAKAFLAAANDNSIVVKQAETISRLEAELASTKDEIVELRREMTKWQSAKKNKRKEITADEQDE